MQICSAQSGSKRTAGGFAPERMRLADGLRGLAADSRAAAFGGLGGCGCGRAGVHAVGRVVVRPPSLYLIIGHYSVSVRNLHVDSSEVLYNAKIKCFPDGSRSVMVCSAPCFRRSGWELSTNECSKTVDDGDAVVESRFDNIGRAMRRARAAVRDIARSNRFSYFVTLTLNREKVDRYDMAAITKKLNNWLDNQVRRRGLKYVLVPERHKDGAIHFHGFFNDALAAVPSGHYSNSGQMIYNLPAWSLGFTAAIELYGDYNSAVSYVCKYIGKQGEKPGGRWYYSGGQLEQPNIILANLEYESIPQNAYSFSIDDCGRLFWIWEED